MIAPTRWFFIAALALLAGASAVHFLVLVGLVWLWSAAVHLTIFGWITAMIVAVSYHTMPVFSARDFPYPRLILLHCGVLVAGLVLSAAGFALRLNALLVAGLVLEAIAALVYLGNIRLLFGRGPRRPHAHPVPPLPNQRDIDRLGSYATRLASLALPTSLLLLAAVYQGLAGSGWLLAAEHLAALGWIGLMVVGVAIHILPRFSGRALRGYGWARLHVGAHAAALAMIVFGLGFGWSPVFATGAMLMAFALAAFAFTIWPTLTAIRTRSSVSPITLREHAR